MQPQVIEAYHSALFTSTSTCHHTHTQTRTPSPFQLHLLPRHASQHTNNCLVNTLRASKSSSDIRSLSLSLTNLFAADAHLSFLFSLPPPSVLLLIAVSPVSLSFGSFCNLFGKDKCFLREIQQEVYIY